MPDVNLVEFHGTIKNFKVSGEAGEETLQLVIETSFTDQRIRDLGEIGMMKQRGSIDVKIAPLFVQPGMFDKDLPGAPPVNRCQTCLQDGSEVFIITGGQCPTCNLAVPEGASFGLHAECKGTGRVQDEFGDTLTNGETTPCEGCHGSGYLRSRCLYVLGPDEEKGEFARETGLTVECGVPLPCSRHPEAPAESAQEADELPDSPPPVDIASKRMRKPKGKK